jgi:hypothetical protein
MCSWDRCFLKVPRHVLSPSSPHFIPETVSFHLKPYEGMMRLKCLYVKIFIVCSENI